MKKLIQVFFVLALLSPMSAFAFCGFYAGGAGKNLYSDATSVIMMRDGTTTTLSMQNDYAGPAKDFAMVIPVPEILAEKDVKTLSPKLFDKVDRLSAPRLVEYWERDPCKRERRRRKGAVRKTTSKSAGLDSLLDSSVVVEAEFDVEEYQIVILSAEDSSSLEKWLKENKYAIPKKAAKYFQPYVQAGMYFFVAKVDITKVKKKPGGGYRLSPLRFTYESDNFTLPIRLGLINSRGSQDLFVHILAEDKRYDVANYPAVAMPTNLELKKSAKNNFGSYYQSLFNAVLKANPKAVVTEYAWSAKNCDPCPGPTLNRSDLLELGGDRIDANLNDFVLTRLHTRYKAGKIGEDLIFKAAPAIEGGVEGRGKKTVAAYSNQFQSRYIIRHRWKKKTRCRNPRYKTWRTSKPKSTLRATKLRKTKRGYRGLTKGKINLRHRMEKIKSLD